MTKHDYLELGLASWTFCDVILYANKLSKSKNDIKSLISSLIRSLDKCISESSAQALISHCSAIRRYSSLLSGSLSYCRLSPASTTLKAGNQRIPLIQLEGTVICL